MAEEDGQVLVVHISDWNSRERVLSAPRDKALAILRDVAKPAGKRMRELLDLALASGDVKSDPRTSELDEAELFLSWSSQLNPPPIGFVAEADWDRAFADELIGLDLGE